MMLSESKEEFKRKFERVHSRKLDGPARASQNLTMRGTVTAQPVGNEAARLVLQPVLNHFVPLQRLCLMALEIQAVRMSRSRTPDSPPGVDT
jgi:hypothetical protein